MKGNKNQKLSNKLQRELEKQGVRFKQKNNNAFVIPPHANLDGYTWHKSDRHIGEFVDYIIARWKFLNFKRLIKVHKRFTKAL